ncbi:alpha/beta hydrolase [Catellatospora sp. NPDC049111]|uniref:alpha/beta fold hydrolase n=1 Tax=Catellatospora sp. NPDC049111 TaxID=3155271 RepID=UPI0033F9120A
MDDVIVRAVAALLPGGATRGEIAFGQRKLRWIEAGTGGPTVVLDAASGTPALTWLPILPALVPHTRVIAYDRAGFGASDPATPLTFESQLDDLRALLSQAGGGPCVLVGNSWGGLLAQVVAWSDPDLVAGLVLVDPAHEEFRPWIVRAAEAVFARADVVRQALGRADRPLREQAAEQARRLTDDPRVQDLLVEAEMACHAQEQRFRTGIAESRMVAGQVRLVRRLRSGSRLPDVPVVVLSATVGLPNGMRTRWTALQAEVAAAAPRGEHAVVPEAGHYIHSSRPDAVTEAVLAVVEKARFEQGA